MEEDHSTDNQTSAAARMQHRHILCEQADTRLLVGKRQGYPAYNMTEVQNFSPQSTLQTRMLAFAHKGPLQSFPLLYLLLRWGRA